MSTLQKKRRAFTLIEVLISVGLWGMRLTALFSTVSMMKDSNDQLYTYLQKAKTINNATKVLYMDIVSSDGNISIKKDEFTRLCIEQTAHSLYELSLAKVCWVVLKDKHTLARVEGNNYKLPTRFEDRVEVDRIIKHIELFDVYHQKDKVLVFLKQKGRDAISFMIQGVSKPIIKKPIKNTKKTSKTKPTRQTRPPNTQVSKPITPQQPNRPNGQTPQTGLPNTNPTPTEG